MYNNVQLTSKVWVCPNKVDKGSPCGTFKELRNTQNRKIKEQMHFRSIWSPFKISIISLHLVVVLSSFFFLGKWFIFLGKQSKIIMRISKGNQRKLVKNRTIAIVLFSTALYTIIARLRLSHSISSNNFLQQKIISKGNLTNLTI